MVLVAYLEWRQCESPKNYTTKRKSHLADNITDSPPYTKNKDIWKLLKHNSILSQIEIAKNIDYTNLNKIIGNTSP